MYTRSRGVGRGHAALREGRQHVAGPYIQGDDALRTVDVEPPIRRIQRQRAFAAPHGTDAPIRQPHNVDASLVVGYVE